MTFSLEFRVSGMVCIKVNVTNSLLFITGLNSPTWFFTQGKKEREILNH